MIGITNVSAYGEEADMTSAPIAAYLGHGSTTTSWITPSSYLRVSYNAKYFSYEDGVFTAVQDMTVIISPFLNQMYNQNTGSSNTGTCEIRINGTSVWTGSRSAPTSTNAFANTTVSLSAGDTVQYRCHGDTSAYITGGIGIRLAAS